MASAKTLSNLMSSTSRKEHLEAGKRRLEEFRKKRAEGRAKKSSSTGHTQVDHGGQQTLSHECEREKCSKPDSSMPGSDDYGSFMPSLSVARDDNEADAHYRMALQDSLNLTDSSSLAASHKYNISHDHPSHRISDIPMFNISDGSGFPPTGYRPYSHQREDNSREYDLVRSHSDQLTGHLEGSGISLEKPFSSSMQIKAEFSRPSSVHDKTSSGMDLPGVFSDLKDSLTTEPCISAGTSGKSALLLNSVSTGFKVALPLDSNEKKPNGTVDLQHNMENASLQVPRYYTSDAHSGSFLNQTLFRVTKMGDDPSFLSLHNTSSSSLFSESGKAEAPFLSQSETIHSSNVHQPIQEPVYHDFMSASNHFSLENPSIKSEFFSKNKDEDFAALEQHIEDLTQEKFSLQRSLEAARALSQSLAAENSSITDSFNLQGTVVNQLKSDMEKLQEEIKEQLAELEVVKVEYANAQLECSAADERAKVLASEVIGWEEKALRMKSNELKLERDLENSMAELSSHKRKVSSLEKERRELLSTIDNLKEEKKLLQSKLRASSSGKVVGGGKVPTTKDVSTSTDDLDADSSDLVDTKQDDVESDASAAKESKFSTILSKGNSYLPQADHAGLLEPGAIIPPDQLRIISNINSLISELALEKEQLLQSLAAESSSNSRLKALNKELSQKLEAQTQRLELLTAQNMAINSIRTKQPGVQITHDNTVYTDEGDEVVERVLSWIMRLFPGGTAQRQMSKLLS